MRFSVKEQNEIRSRKLLLSHLGEALTAINRAILAGLKGYSGLFATGCADCGVHFALRTGSVLAGITAGLASLGLIHKALGSIKFLLAGSENEFFAAFFADESLVFVHGCLPHLDKKILPFYGF